ncbi:MAG: dihydrolipoyl dehydrogenase [Candidatus Thermoplasmatota archaeon]|nr:dihydrolipoyl dehydrogenase [Candidatus Thermoplasmatota archaeon]
MKTYDVIIIGSGSGGEIVKAALNKGKTVAWIEKGPLGGTCLNVGCIPSKMVIYPADRIMEIKEADKLGIKAEIKDVDFKRIMAHMREPIDESHNHMEHGLSAPIKGFQYYHGEGYFIDNYEIIINNEIIKGEKIFIGSGARPHIPSIKGLEAIDYLTNNNIFSIQEKPKSMIIIGGGYIAVELAHFFEAMGTKITILQRGNRLIKMAEPEISSVLYEFMGKRMTIELNISATEVKKEKDQVKVIGINESTNQQKEFTAETILVATGRTSNADLLHLENTNIELDKYGYIKVNEYMETSKENIWAFGDATGKYMFKHVANEEALFAWKNASTENKHAMDYSAVPYAVFTYPQIAGVGLSEKEAKQSYQILVGKAYFKDVIKGQAMMELKGFAKGIVNKEDETILGFHIIGPYAPILIQEVVNAMALGGKIEYIGRGMHIHPALPELILRTLGNLREPEPDDHNI